MEMLGQAVLAGVAPDVFWSLTLTEYHHIMTAWGKHQTHLYRTTWEQARWIATTSISPHITKSINPKSLLTFPWEKDEEKIDWDDINKRLSNLPKTIPKNFTMQKR